MVSKSESERGELGTTQTGPSPNSATPRHPDALFLLDLFPAELWKKILKNVLNQNDPQDHSNLTNASSFFRDELLPHRIFFLFPLVYPLLQKYLISSEILKCRELCSSWNTAILASFIDHPSHQTLSFTPSASTPYLPTPPVFQYGGHIRSFRDHFQGTHCDPALRELLPRLFIPQEIDEELSTNPFPSRAVTLFIPQGKVEPPAHLNLTGPSFSSGNSVRVPEVDPELVSDAVQNGLEQAVTSRPDPLSRAQWDMLTFHTRIQIGMNLGSLVRIFGHHVFYCTVNSPSASSRDFCYYLSEWMSSMRNLKVLRINFRGNDEGYDLTTEPCPNAREHNKITKLDHLEFLQVCKLPKLIFQELLRVNSHIKKLKVTGIQGNGGIFDKHLPNLTALSISLEKAEEFLKVQEPDLGAWKLEELYLQIGDYEDDSDLDQWSRIFTVIQIKWGATLKRVEVQLPDSVNKTELNEMLQENYSLMSITTIL